MTSIIRTNSRNKDFIDLIERLDADLNKRYGDKQSDYTQFNVIQTIDTVIIVYIDDLPAGCGCFKQYNQDCVEIKRMYVKPESRGMGISKKILNELEKWALEIGFSKSILETGINQPEAIGLYEKSGYTRIANYGQYMGINTSVCFEKDLRTINNG
jgi:putative acetyltransferase